MSAEAKTMTVTLTIEVEAIQGRELDEAGFYEGLGSEGEDEMTNLIADYDPAEIARLIPFALTHPDNEMFAGSGLFVKLGKIAVEKAGWTE